MDSPVVLPEHHPTLVNHELHPAHIPDHEHHDNFGRDGKMTKVIEEIPIIGFVKAGIHASNGDRDRALRAVAKCSSSTIHAGTMLAANIATGGLGLLPTLALGAFAGGVGFASEQALKQQIECPKVKEDCSPATTKDLALTAGFGSAFALVGGAGGAVAKSFVQEIGKTGVTKHATGFVAGQTVNQIQVAPVKRDVKERINILADDEATSITSQVERKMARRASRQRRSSTKRRDKMTASLSRPRSSLRRRSYSQHEFHFY